MTKTIFTAILIFGFLVVRADDFAVTAANDTLRGKVSIQTYGNIDHVQVISSDKKKKTLTAIQVRAVSLAGQIYHPVRTDYGYRMMKLVTPGFASLYLGKAPIPNSGQGFYYDTPFIVKKDGSAIEVPNLGFKKVITNFLNECATLKDKLEEENWGKKDIDVILSEYNRCIEGQTKKMNIPGSSPDNPKVAALLQLNTKIQNSSLAGKQDAVDILSDIVAKVRNGQVVPNYQIDGLKNILKESPELSGEFEKAIALANH
jgi:hypothetical protein